MQEMFHTVTFVHSLKCLSISFQVLGPQLFVSLSVVLGFIDVNSHMSKLSGLAWSTCCTAVDGTVRPKGGLCSDLRKHSHNTQSVETNPGEHFNFSPESCCLSCPLHV